MWNFLRRGRSYYGFASAGMTRRAGRNPSIALRRLGGLSSAKSISGVTVVWTARNPEAGGVYVVGWYQDAVVYRDLQPVPARYARRSQGFQHSIYYCSGPIQGARLLPEEERVLRIPIRTPGGKGQCNWWYADHQKQRGFVRAVRTYIRTNGRVAPRQEETVDPPSSGGGAGWQLDPDLRRRIEERAVRLTVRYFQERGFRVERVDRECLGWDLNAVKGRTLRVEVKGMSGHDIGFDLTPREHEMMQRHRSDYVVAVLPNALKAAVASMRVFAYSPLTRQWTSNGDILRVQERTGARCSA